VDNPATGESRQRGRVKEKRRWLGDVHGPQGSQVTSKFLPNNFKHKHVT